MNRYFAHNKENVPEDKWEPLKIHLFNVSKGAGSFAQKFNHKALAEAGGLFHDFGKYSREYQEKLHGQRPKAEHSTAGAVEVSERFPELGKKILAYCLAGHHMGLADTGTIYDELSLKGRLKARVDDYSAYRSEFKEHELNLLEPSLNFELSDGKRTAFTVAFLTRMIFSCLVDADYFDMLSFIKNDKNPRLHFESLKELSKNFERYISKFTPSDTLVNKKRQEVLNACIENASLDKGFFRLTVPTGGGKTISSMAFALNHAIKHNQDRIIYAVPFTSIIEQNAQTFREIFGAENVLEQHCSYTFENKKGVEDQTTKQKLQFAAQNWDAPIVVTTNTQFFESLFANGSSKCKKLHNIANSVIILDEAQVLPIEYLKPCLRALEELVVNYNCTVILCTATQPSLDCYISGGIKICDIIPSSIMFKTFFERVEVQKAGVKSDNELIKELRDKKQVLTIVNTEEHAKNLYRLLKNEDGVYYLSAFMCPIHRKKKINQIKTRMLDDTLATRLFSTQLIEAGVDIDFPYVYRTCAGLDSVVQAAGRCNRNGKFEKGYMKVFHSLEAHGKPYGYLKRTSQIGEKVASEFENLISFEAIARYFELLYSVEENRMDSKNILESFKLDKDGYENFKFRTVARNFNMIERNTISIVIPYDDYAAELIGAIKGEASPKKYLKQLLPYTVSVYENDYLTLKGHGALKEVNYLTDVLIDMSRYDEKEGLIIN